MTVGRRGLLGFLGGAAAAGPQALRAAVEGMGATLRSPLPLNAVAKAAVGGVSSGEVGHALSIFTDMTIPEPLKNMMRVAMNRLEQEQMTRNDLAQRIAAGFDPDIAANKSWSPAYKAHLQGQRLSEERAALYALRERVWGH